MMLIIKSILWLWMLQLNLQENKFEITGSGCDVDYVILIDGAKQDTIKLINSKFYFSGTVDTAHLVYLKISGDNIKREFILEPGKISFNCKTGKDYIVTGTLTNESYFEYKHGMDSTTAIVMALYQVYLKKETEEEKKQAMREYNNAEEVRLAFMRKQLRKNPNYTGLMILKPIYRTDSLVNLKGYLDLLKDYSYTDIYQEVDHYQSALNATAPGKPAPSFHLLASNGNKVSLEQFKGKYVLLDFWFTGCTYCDMLLPHLKSIYKDINKKGFEIVDISVDKDKETWLKSVKKKEAPGFHLFDPEKTVASSYGMPGYPTLVLIDREGKVVKRLIGYRNEKELRDEIMPAFK